MKLSVIVPLYNNEKYILECLESIKSQTYKNIQVIVVDNESTDNSKEIASNFCLENNWEFYIAENLFDHSWHEPTREGMKKIAEDVEWFTFIASDDKIMPDYIENNISIISKLKSVEIPARAIQSPIRGFGERSGIIEHKYPVDLEIYKKMLLEKCIINTPSVIWHKSLIEDGLMETHPELYKGADDYWMYLNQADKGLIIYPFNKYLGYDYRWSNTQATWGMIKNYSGMDKKIQDEWKLKWQK